MGNERKEENGENDDENPENTSLEVQIDIKKAMDIKNYENLEDELKKLKEKVKNQEITIETYF